MIRTDLELQPTTIYPEHPNHLRQVLQDNKDYVKGYVSVRFLLGNGLVLSEGAFWRRQRLLM